MLGRNSSEGSEVPALLPRAAGAPSLEALKAGLDGTLGSLSRGCNQPTAGVGAQCS